MKKKFNLMLYVGSLILCLATLITCTDNDIVPENIPDTRITTRAIVAPDFDWESIDEMPTPPDQYISIPWTGTGVLTVDQTILFDYKKEDGWEMLYHTFFTDKGFLSNPYFILYNKFRGLMRVYLYINTPFVTTSQHIQDYLVVTNNTSMLNYLTTGMIDQDMVNVRRYEQMHDQKISTNKWYMMEYEMAYDPNISNYNFDQISLQWGVLYHDITRYSLNGNSRGTIVGTVGSGSNTFSSGLMSMGKATATGALSGLGYHLVEKDSLNKLGLSNANYNSLLRGLSSSLSGSAGDFLKSLGSTILSGVFGRKSPATPVNLRIDTKFDITGNASSSGQLPGTMTFYVPGTGNLLSAPGYIPLYNKTLGVVNFRCDDEITFHADYIIYIYEVLDPQYGHEMVREEQHYADIKELSMDFTNYLIINPEVLNVADVIVLNQEILIYNDPNFIETPRAILPTFNDYQIRSNASIRFTLEIKPKDASMISQHIVKTFKLKNVKYHIDRYYDTWESPIN